MSINKKCLKIEFKSLFDIIWWDILRFNSKNSKSWVLQHYKKENNPDTIKKELTQSIKREFIVVLYFVFSTIKKGISVHPKKEFFDTIKKRIYSRTIKTLRCKYIKKV